MVYDLTGSKFKSPISYVGGKYWIIENIWNYIPADTTEIVSPFFGGGALELNLSYFRGIKVHANDKCPLLVNFWKHFLQDPNRIINDAKDICRKYEREHLIRLKKGIMLRQTVVPSPYMKAVYFYLFNKLGYQGITNHSYVIPFRIIDDEFYRPTTKAKIFRHKSWDYFRGLDIDIKENIFQKSLTEKPDTFAYIDPPYLTSEMVFSRNKEIFDHNELNEILKSRDNWILSYGHFPQAPYIKLAYQDYYMQEYSRRTGFNNSIQKSNQIELLIFSHDIAELVRSQPKQMSLF